jgi:hypothetical protein
MLLSVQAKPDCLVFTSLTPLDRTYPFTYSFTSLLSSLTVEATQEPLVAISLFIHGILCLLGEINSPRIGVSASPTGFPHPKVFSPNPRSPCSMDGFAIPLVHWFYSCHRSIPCSISNFPWLNRSDSELRVKSVQTELSSLLNWTIRFWQTAPSFFNFGFFIVAIEILCIYPFNNA